jgi:hypothetical protein
MTEARPCVLSGQELPVTAEVDPGERPRVRHGAFGTRSGWHSVRLPRHVCEPVPPSRSAVASAQMTRATQCGDIATLGRPSAAFALGAVWHVAGTLVIRRVFFKVVSIRRAGSPVCGHS